MITTLLVSVLAVCAVITLLRIPAALRGENRSLFGIFLLATVAMVLSIQASYDAIDHLLGSQNYANLILRFVIYGTVLLAGYKIAKGFENKRSLRLLLGPAGLTALALICLATAVPFLLANTAGTSVGLATLPDQSEHNRQLIALYTLAGRLYPAYVAACLLPATIHALRSRLPGLVRGGAALLTLGSIAMVVMPFSDLVPRGLTFLQYYISSAAVMGLVLGLALIWLGRLSARRSVGSGLKNSHESRMAGPAKTGKSDL
ncbi:hypothetical protein QWJ39_15100 [Arthrobacter sp. YD4]|uniref:hypothetical protein n=1 Tax=Arthrobacter sp. YD4 TaxID=3058043 RepID=UPI0025B28B26|nr:hypothetical protein [Arthrobacter sp. YD4]MDN3937631.1 hypothetical protein [Arthrobacter sp. YD4]